MKVVFTNVHRAKLFKVLVVLFLLATLGASLYFPRSALLPIGLGMAVGPPTIGRGGELEAARQTVNHARRNFSATLRC